MIPKASLEAICIGGVFIVGGLLGSLGINNNMIISGMNNYIPIPSNLWYVVKKACDATFMRISGFACNYPCRILCNKGECAELGRMVKEIYLCDGELVQLIRIDSDAYKGRLEEVLKKLEVSLNQI